MAKKDKKGKKKATEDNWEESPKPQEETPIEKTSSPLDDNVPAVEEDDEFGGLMAQISKASKKDKKGKKKRNAVTDDDYADSTVPIDEASETPAVPTEPPKVLEPDDWADKEFGTANNKKNKKGKEKVTNNKEQSNDVLTRDAPTEIVDDEKTVDTGKSTEDGGEVRILSKKEKEKLKKQKEKEKKKAEIEKKKTQAVTQDAQDIKQEPLKNDKPSTLEPAPDAGEDEEEDEDEDEKSKSKKKKKKKKPPIEEEKKKKKAPNVAGLRAMLEEKRKAEEEQRRKEEEEQKRIEEEQRRLEEEERQKEEAKRLKKEKEKAKKEQLRKEGKLLTKAQKSKQQQAQLRLQQMINSDGIKVEGLVAQDTENKPKKIVYGNKRKKGPKHVEEEKSITEVPIEKAEEKPESNPVEPVQEKDEIEEISSEDKPILSVKETPVKVKENWDESEEEEDNDDEGPKASKSEETVASSAKVADQTVEKKPSPAVQTAQSVKAEVKKPSKPPAKKESEGESEESETENSEDDSEGDSEDSSDELTETQKQALKRKQEAAARRQQRRKDALAARSKDDLRSPICCILGHVDTGKTKLLDKIRQTNVQEGEAGGITQQIGATYFPMDTIKIKTAPLNKDGKQEYNLPGLLVIDTPGHESFTNLRSRGSSLCNIAILVVDIMHGLEPQTLESLRLLRDRKTPFIVALNKIDRMYDWKPIPNNSFQDSLSQQTESVKREFNDRVQKTIFAFAEQGLNSCLYYENTNFAKNVSLVPTSAITGEGIPDMLMLLVNLSQTRMSNQLMYLSELECTVLEVKVIEGLGTTIDVILSNGVLNEGDRIVLCGLNGPIVTTIRALLTPQPLRELRVKSAYVHHKTVKAALGVKISAQDLEKAIAGSRLMVVGPDDDEEDLKDEVMSDLKSLLTAIDKSGRGVCVQASTLGSLEALLEFLKVSKIPVSGINIGPVHKKDIMRAASMLEKAKELAVILCFDVKVDKEAEELADEYGIKIFKADIIYHLFDQFTAYNKDIVEQKRKDQAPQAVFPCVLKIIPGTVFNKRDPIIIGVDVVEGVLRVGTPLCVLKTNIATNVRETISLGKVMSIEQNHKSLDLVKKGQAGGGVAIKIECPVYENPKMFGRHFTESDEFYSKISRVSIDVLKESFRNDLSKDEWALIVRLKKLLNIE